MDQLSAFLLPDDPNFRELLKTLPKQNSGSPFHVDYLYQYKGFWFLAPTLKGILSLHQSFQPLPTDIIVAGAPKSGNTWLKALSFAIATRNEAPLLSNLPHDLLPFLEFDVAENPATACRRTDHPLLSTHIPYPCLPESVLSSGCKIVYICRDPKDVLVSWFHFFRKIARDYLGNMLDSIPFEEAFDLFCQGKSPWGPYWEHVLGYYRASVENPDKILFLKYEEMKRDTLFCVKKLAEFMGMAFTVEEEGQGLPEKMVQLCSFGSLSSLEVNKNGKHRSMMNNSSFFRKGEIGDWKNFLTAEMAERIDRITEEKFKGYDFKFGAAGDTAGGTTP